MIGLEYVINYCNLSQKELAKEIGIVPGTLHDWLTERRKIPSDRLIFLSCKFDIPSRFIQSQITKDELGKEIERYLCNWMIGFWANKLKELS